MIGQIHLYLAYNYDSEVIGWTYLFIFGLELGMQRNWLDSFIYIWLRIMIVKRLLVGQINLYPANIYDCKKNFGGTDVCTLK